VVSISWNRVVKHEGPPSGGTASELGSDASYEVVWMPTDRDGEEAGLLRDLAGNPVTACGLYHDVNRGVASIMNVKRELTARIEGVEPGRQYLFNVIARSLKVGRSMAYDPILHSPTESRDCPPGYRRTTEAFIGEGSTRTWTGLRDCAVRCEVRHMHLLGACPGFEYYLPKGTCTIYLAGARTGPPRADREAGWQTCVADGSSGASSQAAQARGGAAAGSVFWDEVLPIAMILALVAFIAWARPCCLGHSARSWRADIELPRWPGGGYGGRGVSSYAPPSVFGQVGRSGGYDDYAQLG